MDTINHRIRIINCNCIKEADIEIEKESLNIKYGSNGTGKSTISKAIYFKSNNGTELQTLRPYDAEEIQKPDVENLSFSKVRVFDENYVNSYLFEEKSFLGNSFQVFLRSEECDKLAVDIENLLSELQGVFGKTEAIQNLRSFLPKYFDAVKYSDGEISKKGGVGEFLKGNGAGFEKYDELIAYRPFFAERDMPSVSKWAKWRNDGIKQMKGNSCPFCTEDLKEEISRENELISKVFKNSALATASAVLEYLQEAVKAEYIKEDSINILESYMGNNSMEDSLLSELRQLAIETDYLFTKIEKICLFRPMNVTHEQLANIEQNLDDMYIDERQISKFYSTPFICSLISEIKVKIDDLKQNTGKLKGLFIKHEKKMELLIQDRKDDINEFFALAGFPYKFEIRTNGENKAISYLCPFNMNAEEKIAEPDKHLSWGEKNAFSLVMFMFEAISDKADLIVLDDPITSFDKDKKFAVIRRLFDNKKLSFKNHTVVMLTHELQPLIDYVHGDFFRRFGLTTPVKAKLLQNDNGKINEYNVMRDDLINTVELTRKIAGDREKNMAVRVVNLRKYVELVKPNFRETPIYEVLSNIIHGREVALSSDGHKLDDDVFAAGMAEVLNYIEGLSYEQILENVSLERLLNLVDSANIYERIISIRLLFERHDGLLFKLRKKYPAACKFVNETNHVENDYIFQLDPFKYFTIPPFYLSEIVSFINDEKNELT